MRLLPTMQVLNMNQQTLFGEPKKKEEAKEEPKKREYKPKVTMKDPDEPETVSIGDKAKYGWKQLPDNETKKRLGFDVHSLDLFAHSDLNGVTYSVSLDHHHEHPDVTPMGSSYGCGGKFDPYNLESIKGFFDSLMEQKKNDLTEPYRTFTEEEAEIKYAHHDIYYEFRLIPANQYYVVIGDELLKMLKEKGFDFEAWYTQYKALPDFVAGEKHWEQALEKLRLLEQGGKIDTKLENLIKILEMDDEENVLDKTKQDVRALFDMNLKELDEINKKIGENSVGNDEYGYDIERYKDRLMKTLFGKKRLVIKEKRQKAKKKKESEE